MQGRYLIRHAQLIKNKNEYTLLKSNIFFSLSIICYNVASNLTDCNKLITTYNVYLRYIQILFKKSLVTIFPQHDVIKKKKTKRKHGMQHP